MVIDQKALEKQAISDEDPHGHGNSAHNVSRQDVHIQTWMPDRGCLDVAARTQLPGHGCHGLATRTWLLGLCRQNWDTRMWPPGYGCQGVVARTLLPGCGCLDVAAWESGRQEKASRTLPPGGENEDRDART